MLLGRLSAAFLVVLVSLPGFLIGQKLREGEASLALALLPIAVAVVVVASMLMRTQRD